MQHCDVEAQVSARYAAGAQALEPQLCAPVSYDPALLRVIPHEIIERDYGCGDPSQFVREGETVLDLGSGGGKICYILSQIVGAKGKVVGVDMTDEMLDLARRHQAEVASKIGYSNVSFLKGKIQDLKLDLDRVQQFLASNPVTTVEGWFAFEAECNRLRDEAPLIADGTIDVIVSNCVLNLVKQQDKATLFAEMYRVLKEGGRAVISDIVCDEDVPAEMMADAHLWSGCISGAYREDSFLRAFESAGFVGVEILKRDNDPWQVVNGIEFRSVTVRAYKLNTAGGRDLGQAVVYKGPWKAVEDDFGHVLQRGVRYAVSNRLFAAFTGPQPIYGSDDVLGLDPGNVGILQAEAFQDSKPLMVRQASALKRATTPATGQEKAAKACCAPTPSCCGPKSKC